MRVVVTGAGGFIGTPLVRVLRERGDAVQAVSLRAAGWEDEVRAARPEACYHLAWVARGAFWTDLQNHDCLAAGRRLLRTLPDGCRFVGVGTCYERPDAPPTLYARCKQRMREAAEASGRPASWVRLFYQFGPGEEDRRLVPFIIRGLLAGRPVELSAGTQVRDFLYVDDVARAIAAAGPGLTEVGTGEGVAVRGLAEKIGAMLGRADLLRFGPPADEPARLVADAAALRATGWRPQVPLDEGLARTIAWWRAQLHDQ